MNVEYDHLHDKSCHDTQLPPPPKPNAVVEPSKPHNEQEQMSKKQEEKLKIQLHEEIKRQTVEHFRRKQEFSRRRQRVEELRRKQKQRQLQHQIEIENKRQWDLEEQRKQKELDLEERMMREREEAMRREYRERVTKQRCWRRMSVGSVFNPTSKCREETTPRDNSNIKCSEKTIPKDNSNIKCRRETTPRTCDPSLIHAIGQDVEFIDGRVGTLECITTHLERGGIWYCVSLITNSDGTCSDGSQIYVRERKIKRVIGNNNNKEGTTNEFEPSELWLCTIKETKKHKEEQHNVPDIKCDRGTQRGMGFRRGLGPRRGGGWGRGRGRGFGGGRGRRRGRGRGMWLCQEKRGKGVSPPREKQSKSKKGISSPKEKQSKSRKGMSSPREKQSKSRSNKKGKLPWSRSLSKSKSARKTKTKRKVNFQDDAAY